MGGEKEKPTEYGALLYMYSDNSSSFKFFNLEEDGNLLCQSHYDYRRRWLRLFRW